MFVGNSFDRSTPPLSGKFAHVHLDFGRCRQYLSHPFGHMYACTHSFEFDRCPDAPLYIYNIIFIIDSGDVRCNWFGGPMRIGIQFASTGFHAPGLYFHCKIFFFLHEVVFSGTVHHLLWYEENCQAISFTFILI